MNLLAINFKDPVVLSIIIGAAVVLLVVIIAIIVAASKSKKKKKAKAEAERKKAAAAKKAEEEKPVAKVEEEKPVKETATETTTATTTTETSESNSGAPARQTIKVTVKPKEEKPVQKQTVKITEKNKPEPEQPVKETAPETKKDDGTRIYHIAKRKDDGKWQVKAEGAEKALKLFDTQAEAIDYAKGLVANNPDAQIRIHKVDGSYRKLTY